MKAVVLFLLFFGLAVVRPAKILGIFHVASFSHFAPAQTLMNALVEQGHDVTVAAVYKNNDSKFKLIHLDGFEKALEEKKKTMNLFDTKFGNWKETIDILHSLGNDLAKQTLQHPNMQALLKSNEKFDMVIMEQFVNEAFHGFCYHFNASCILYSAIPTNTWINPLSANPQNPSYTRDIYLPTTSPMDFLSRVHNTILWLYEHAFYRFVMLPSQNSLMHQYIPNVPDLKGIIYNADLVFLNSHMSYSDPIPFVHNMIEIGGFHVKPPKKLPEDLQKFFDGAKEGVVYFSMGSVLKPSEMSEEKRSAFLKAFGRLKQRVLWKFDEDIPTPENVKVLKWIPQKDILAHPNMKLFITHGGLFSIIEAIHFGVPIIGIPIFGDQPFNMIKSQQDGIGISFNYHNATEDAIYEAIRKVLDNNMYAENIKKRSRLLRNRPMKPLDTFVYWIQHVLENKGGKHLKSPALNLDFYQVMLLDVIAFLGGILSTVFIIITLVIKKVCCGKKNVTPSKKKKKQ